MGDGEAASLDQQRLFAQKSKCSGNIIRDTGRAVSNQGRCHRAWSMLCGPGTKWVMSQQPLGTYPVMWTLGINVLWQQ